MTRCDACHRRLILPPIVADGGTFGPKCYAARYGTKPRKTKREDKRSADDKQVELFVEARA